MSFGQPGSLPNTKRPHLLMNMALKWILSAPTPSTYKALLASILLTNWQRMNEGSVSFGQSGIMPNTKRPNQLMGLINRRK
jgi:hypothetical protein